MPTRLYPLNQAAPYTPATVQGTWNTSASLVTRKLGTAKLAGDTNANLVTTKDVATTPYNVAMLRFVSDALPADKTFTVSDTLTHCLGAYESSTSANNKPRVTAYVTVGDSDTVRGYLKQNWQGAAEWSATGRFRNSGALALAGTVNALAGDRIVFIIGYQAVNTATTYTGQMWYGAAATMSDGADTSTTVTVEAGWVEFSQADLFTVTLTGVGAAAFIPPTADLTGSETFTGTGETSLPLLASTGEGGTETSVTGVGADALPLLISTGEGTAVLAITGTGTPYLPGLQANGAGLETFSGTGASVLPSTTTAGSGALAFTGTVASVTPLPTASLTGLQSYSSSGAPVFVLSRAALSGLETFTTPVGANRWALVGADDTTKLATWKAGGGTDTIVQAYWTDLQLSSGAALDATAVAALNTRITDAKAAGLNVILSCSIQYPPAWVKTAIPKYKNQSGATWDSTSSGEEVRDWTWTQVGRTAISDFIHKVLAAVDKSLISGIRMGGGYFGELQYPRHGGDGSNVATIKYWGYGDAAQTGVGLASGMSVCPYPGYSLYSGDSVKDVAWVDWYLQSLTDQLLFIIDCHRDASYTGPLHVLHPGFGIRSNWTTAQYAYRIEVAEGHDWVRQMDAYESLSAIYPWSTWVDAAHAWPADPWSVDSNKAGWAKLWELASARGLNTYLFGENTGTFTQTIKDRVFGPLGAIGGGYYSGYMHLNWDLLASGAPNISLSDLQAAMAEIDNANGASLPLPMASGGDLVDVTASGSPSLPLSQSAASGTELFTGSAASAFTTPTSTIAGAQAHIGASAPSFVLPRSAASGAESFVATASPSLPLPRTSGVGLETFSSSGAGAFLRPVSEIQALAFNGVGGVVEASLPLPSVQITAELEITENQGAVTHSGAGSSLFDLILAEAFGLIPTRGQGVPRFDLPFIYALGLSLEDNQGKVIHHSQGVGNFRRVQSLGQGGVSVIGVGA